MGNVGNIFAIGQVGKGGLKRDTEVSTLIEDEEDGGNGKGYGKGRQEGRRRRSGKQEKGQDTAKEGGCRKRREGKGNALLDVTRFLQVPLLTVG